ncbi:MAG: hypothetical protein MI742_15515 [Desulfobacterales bacterium]|nr:hypothetical protein [Desulfobacterales bacterium]
MSAHFDELFTIQGVHGVFHLSDNRKPLYSQMASGKEEAFADEREVVSFLSEKMTWESLAPLCGDGTDGEILYDAVTVYFRKTAVGLVLVLMAPGCVVSMVKMTCDLIANEIEKSQKSRGLGRFFKM